MFEFLGKLISGIFFFSKEATQKTSVKDISVGGNQGELQKHYNQSKLEFENSNLRLYKVYDLACEILREALENAHKQSNLNFQTLPRPILELVLDTTVNAIKHEKLFDFPQIDFSQPIPLSEQIELKRQIQSVNLRTYESDGIFAFWASFENVLKHFLLSVGTATRNGDGKESNTFDSKLIHFTSELPLHVERMIISFFTETNAKMNLFTDIRHQLLVNVDVASGLGSSRTPEQRQDENDRTKLPTEANYVGAGVAESYLNNTYFENLYDGDTQASIPLSLRFEHTHSTI